MNSKPDPDAAPANAQADGGTSTAVQLLRRSLEARVVHDITGWAELCDVNVVVEFPFANDEASRRTVGRTAIYDYLQAYPKVVGLRKTRARIYATDDPSRAIAEWSVAGQVIGNGNPYEMSYATFATFKDGLIVNYREYWNPYALIAAMDGTMF